MLKAYCSTFSIADNGGTLVYREALVRSDCLWACKFWSTPTSISVVLPLLSCSLFPYCLQFITFPPWACPFRLFSSPLSVLSLVHVLLFPLCPSLPPMCGSVAADWLCYWVTALSLFHTSALFSVALLSVHCACDTLYSSMKE